MSRPSATVLITAYRRERYVEAAVRSAAASMGERPEIVLVKDVEMREVDRLVEGELGGTVLTDPTLRDPGQMLAAGLEVARGEAVAFCDDDDTMHSYRLPVALSLLRAYPRVVLVRNGYEPVGEDGAPCDPAGFPPPVTTSRFLHPTEGARTARWIEAHGAVGCLSTTTVRREAALRQIDRIRRVEACTDAGVAIPLLEEGSLLAIPDLFTFRRVGTSVRTQGLAGEAERTLRTMRYLERTAAAALARAYARLCVLSAEASRFLLAPGACPPWRSLLAFARSSALTRRVASLEVAAFAILAGLFPVAGRAAYARRRAGWAR